METLLEELTRGLPTKIEVTRVAIRLLASMFLGAIIGLEREHSGKPAGLRTHMLVALGSAMFVLGSASIEMTMDGLSRVIQGVATGIGFLGAGAILKHRDEKEIEGLTTAAGIWLTAAMGVAVAMGRLGLAIAGVVLTWLVLWAMSYLSRRIGMKRSTFEGDAKE